MIDEMSITQNPRAITQEMLVTGRSSATFNRSSLLSIASFSADSATSVLHRNGSTVVRSEVDQPIDFSVRTCSSSPSPQQPIDGRIAESLLMLSETSGDPKSSSSQLSSTDSNEKSRANKRKPNGVQKRNQQSPSQTNVNSGLVTVNQRDGDVASQAWQSSAVTDQCSLNSQTASNIVSTCNFSLCSASTISNDSFSPSSNGDVSNQQSNNAQFSKRFKQTPQKRNVPLSKSANEISMDDEDEDDDGERIMVRTQNGIVNRRRPRIVPEERKDESYWERRRKNNEAAKRSRDARRQKEDVVLDHCRNLEQENKRLRDEIAALRVEIEELRSQILAVEKQKSGENSENCDPVVENRDDSTADQNAASNSAPISDQSSMSNGDANVIGANR